MTVDIKKHLKMTCRYCETPLGPAFLDLGLSPLANSFLTREDLAQEEFICPLSLVRCKTCGLVQLTHVVPADLMFAHYLYVSSTTQTFKIHFAEYAKAVKSRLLKKENALAVDIGSNDGLLLACYMKEGMRAVGVDPAGNLAEEANKKGLKTIHGYWGDAAAQKILKEDGKADAISANNVFAHIDDIHDVLKNVKKLLAPQGMFVTEFPYLVTMLEDMVFDMIYHEHLSYIAVTPLQYVLKKFGLEIFAIQPVASHGGSLRVFIQHEKGGHPISKEVGEYLKKEAEKKYTEEPAYSEFAKRVYQVKKDLLKFVADAKRDGKTISGYGAPAKSTTIISFCEFTEKDIAYIVDDNPLKQNRLNPGAHIPIVPSSHLFEKPTDYVIIFAWNFAPEILKKLEPLRSKGVKFIIPLPKPKIA